MVLIELACAAIPPAPRARTLQNLGLLQTVNQASLADVMAFVERERLYGLGCGTGVDMALLDSTLITPGARLWTQDKRLAGLAQQFSVTHRL